MIKRNLDLIIFFALMVLAAGLFFAWLFREVVSFFLLRLSQLTLTTLSVLAMLLVVAIFAWLRSKLFIWRELIQQARLRTQAHELANRLQEAEVAMQWAKVSLVKAEVQLTESKAQSEISVLAHIKPNERLLVGNGRQFSLVDGQQMLEEITPTTPLITGEDNEARAFLSGQQWIHDFLFDAAGQLKVFHLKTDGPTGVGKTHLMLHMIWLLQQPHPAAEYWLSDPKFEGDESGWPFAPFVSDFEDVASGAEFLYEHVVTARKHAKRAGQPPQHPAFLLFDEADGCFDEHGDHFSKPVRRIIKEGRSGWTHCFVVGQSPLAKDAGFSGALFRNTARLVMGNEALAFINNAQFSFWDKDHRERLKKQLLFLQEHQRRYTLAIPPSGQGLPFVAEIPHLEKPSFVNLASPEQMKLQLLANRSLNGKGPAAVDLLKKYNLTEDQVSDKQFLQDLQKVVQNMDQLRYRGGKPVRASICEILGLPEGGREYYRAQAVAEHLETNAPAEE